MSQEYIERLEGSLVRAVEAPEEVKTDETVMGTYKEAKESIDERDAALRVVFDMKEIESSNIRCVGYSEHHKQLRIQFTNGGVYQYKDVPLETFVEMMNSKSAGAHFSKEIRNAYPCVKIN